MRDGGSRCAAHRVRLGTFADKRRGSRHARGYGSAWDRVRKVVMTRDCGLCQPCLRAGRNTEAHAVDHRLAKAQGGTDDPANLEAICRACHATKTGREAKGGR